MEPQVQFCSGGLVLENNQFCFQFWFWKSDPILVQFWVSQSGTDINLWLAMVQDLFFQNKIIFKKFQFWFQYQNWIQNQTQFKFSLYYLEFGTRGSN
jgi:hypothetical protein